VLIRQPDERRRQGVDASAARALALVYYQTNRYDRCRELASSAAGIDFPLLDLMLAFEDEPYRVEWESGDETVVPFVITDPLPLIDVEVDGHKLTALIDTGGDTFILDPGIAEALGMEIVASLTGTFAGGMKAEVGLARAQTLEYVGIPVPEVEVREGTMGGGGGGPPSAPSP
jgi:hypothetical protein